MDHFSLALFVVCVIYGSLCFSRFWEVVHYDGLSGAAWSDPSTLQHSVQQDCNGGPRGRELHRGGLFHGDLQREGSRPARPQRVRKCLV